MPIPAGKTSGPVRRWEIIEKINPMPPVVDQELSAFPTFFRKILFHRDICTQAGAYRYLNAEADCGSPWDLQGMRATVDRLKFAIAKDEPVVIYGDYDVDGVTATALMVQVLSRLGAVVSPYIPNRFDEGYGLNIDAIEKLAAEGARVILTVDCGIRSLAEAVRAEALGIDLIICDHHQPFAELPQAYAVICQKQPENQYPFQDLSGVGLAYKIGQALLYEYPDCGLDIHDWLDLVALGTVADVVPLKDENRVLVRQGIERLRMGQRPGLFSLAQIAGVKLVTEKVRTGDGEEEHIRQNISSGDIGFIIGPRLNAAGRMDTANDALALLMVEHIEEAGLLAQKLNNKNTQRQEETRRMQEGAEMLARQSGSPEILLAFDPTFNEGILGLAAARLAERYYRPAIVGKRDAEYTRASCRSIREFHITQALDQCRDLLVRHGGHAMAAGFTVRTELLDELVARLTEIAVKELGERELQPVLRADVEIPLAKFETRHFAAMMNWLEQLQPTGQGNPEAVFVSRGVKIRSRSQVGSEKQHLKLKIADGVQMFDAIAFHMGALYATLPDTVDLMYTLEWNTYNGFRNIQLKVRDIKPAGTPD